MALYFQTWISIIGMLIALVMVIVIYLAYRKSRYFSPFKLIPLAYLVEILKVLTI